MDEKELRREKAERRRAEERLHRERLVNLHFKTDAGGLVNDQKHWTIEKQLSRSYCSTHQQRRNQTGHVRNYRQVDDRRGQHAKRGDRVAELRKDPDLPLTNLLPKSKMFGRDMPYSGYWL